MVYFREDGEDLSSGQEMKTSKLEEFFKVYTQNDSIEQLTYEEFPVHYSWKNNQWKKRRSHFGKTIGRMYASSPKDGEKFYLRLLLFHVKGPKDFQCVRTFEGEVYDTFKDAAIARGLLQNDGESFDCLAEASIYAMPNQLRSLFVSVLVYCEPSNVSALWDSFKHDLIEDHLQESSQEVAEALCLRDMQSMLLGFGKKLQDFQGLPPLHIELLPSSSRIASEERFRRNFSADLLDRLNNDQREAFEQLNIALFTNDNKSKLFYLDGPGGTGKTYLYSVMMAYWRNLGKIVLPVASSGIAATLLLGGRTAHNRFKIPLQLNSDAVCPVPVQSELANLLKESDIIIWDEAPMAHKHMFESVDRLFKDIQKSEKPFGGKLVIFGGDFRQILPVIPKGSKAQIIEASLLFSYLWEHVTVLKLTMNMRIADAEYQEFLLRVGNGTEVSKRLYDEDFVQIPQDILSTANNLEDFIDEMFPNFSLSDGQSRIILTCKGFG